MLISTEHDILGAYKYLDTVVRIRRIFMLKSLKYVNYLAHYAKMPTIVFISTFMSRINCMLI